MNAVHNVSTATQSRQDTAPMTDRDAHLTRLAADLSARHENTSAQELMAEVITSDLTGHVALVSSFGTEAAILLHMLSEIDPTAEVIFIDTGKHFEETLAYKADLTERLGLTNVRQITPDYEKLDKIDPAGDLWQHTPNRCCYLRRVLPLQKALDGLDGWITGRKRYQAGERAKLPLVEAVDGKLKINPLAAWSKADLDAYFDTHNLPRHPLEAKGYPSIGCAPCTAPVAAGEPVRSGRWANSDKTECGIHMPLSQLEDSPAL